LSAVCLVAAVAPSAASDWPRFRGPNGAGVSNDSGIPIEFGEKKNLLWKVKIPGADKAKFEEAAKNAKEGCPISKLLNATITMDAQLEN
jgi:organic hydroperoxide reductase OsmC/OhrA